MIVIIKEVNLNLIKVIKRYRSNIYKRNIQNKFIIHTGKGNKCQLNNV